MTQPFPSLFRLAKNHRAATLRANPGHKPPLDAEYEGAFSKHQDGDFTFMASAPASYQWLAELLATLMGGHFRGDPDIGPGTIQVRVVEGANYGRHCGVALVSTKTRRLLPFTVQDQETGYELGRNLERDLPRIIAEARAFLHEEAKVA